MVKSGTRKNTNDRLIGCLMAFKRASPARRWRKQNVAISKATSAKCLLVKEVEGLDDIKFATRAAFGLGRSKFRNVPGQLDLQRDRRASSARRALVGELGGAFHPLRRQRAH